MFTSIVTLKSYNFCLKDFCGTELIPNDIRKYILLLFLVLNKLSSVRLQNVPKVIYKVRFHFNMYSKVTTNSKVPTFHLAYQNNLVILSACQ